MLSILGNPDENENPDKVSYSAGVIMGLSLIDIGFEDLDYDEFSAGLKSAFNNSYNKITQQKAIDIFNNYVALLQEELKLKNSEIAQSFWESNKDKNTISTLESGLQFEILKSGTGALPQVHDEVMVNYEGKLLNDKVFDSTKGEGAQKLTIRNMIRGWQEALLLMPVGSKWRLYIPPHLAYGEIGAPPMIQPNSMLIFTVELVDIA